tara:strand:- start:65 stop:1339 length:1275 start_codon:yes stop_codon:yes gene_type:complete
MKKWTNFDIEKIESSADKIIVKKKFKILLAMFIIVTFFLVNLKTIEILSIADGKIIPQGRIKYVQHLEGGIVEEILVKEGEKVDLNQPLVILSKERASSEFEEINTRLKSLDLSILRVEAEKTSLENIELNEQSKSLYDQSSIDFENELLNSRQASINSERKSKKSNILKATKNLENLEKRLKIVEEQEEISEKLLKAEATNRLRHLEILRELSDVKLKIDEQQSIIDLSRYELEKVNSNYNEQLNKELSDFIKQKAELNQRIQKYSDSLNRTILKSPVSGIIKFISVNSKGAIIAPGVTVVEIVPKNEKLIVEAKLPLSEIGYVKSGLNAKIRLNTPEGSRYRPLSGKVQFVGADRISTKNEEEGYYLVKVETLQNSFNKKNENFKLYSGVPVTVGIVIGKRSFLDYFLSPFKSQVSFALSER